MPAGKPIENKWITAKKVGKAGMGVGSGAVSIAQAATGVSTVALATGAAAASATGIGLVVTGAAFTVATCGLSARAAYRSKKHAEALDQIYDRRANMPCEGLDGPQNIAEHKHIADDVLPYAVLQKAEKSARKGVGAVPILGSGSMALYSLGRAIYKWKTNTKGVVRGQMAHDLAEHFLTHDCSLAQAIVSELYSFEEMLWLRTQDSDTVIKLLKRKLAST